MPKKPRKPRKPKEQLELFPTKKKKEKKFSARERKKQTKLKALRLAFKAIDLLKKRKKTSLREKHINYLLSELFSYVKAYKSGRLTERQANACIHLAESVLKEFE